MPRQRRMLRLDGMADVVRARSRSDRPTAADPGDAPVVADVHGTAHQRRRTVPRAGAGGPGGPPSGGWWCRTRPGHRTRPRRMAAAGAVHAGGGPRVPPQPGQRGTGTGHHLASRGCLGVSDPGVPPSIPRGPPPQVMRHQHRRRARAGGRPPPGGVGPVAARRGLVLAPARRGPRLSLCGGRHMDRPRRPVPGWGGRRHHVVAADAVPAPGQEAERARGAAQL